MGTLAIAATTVVDEIGKWLVGENGFSFFDDHESLNLGELGTNSQSM